MTRRVAAIDPSERREVSKALESQLGFDPFRILDNDLPGNENATFQFQAMVGGMHRLAVVRGWKAAERRLGRGPDGGPREAVIRRLEQREEWLEEHGELDDRLSDEHRIDRNSTSVDYYWIVDGERLPEEEHDRCRAGASLRRSSNTQAVATDGGDR